MGDETEIHCTAIDLRGRTVVLDGKGLQHVLEEHREVARIQVIKEGIEKATIRTRGNFAGSEKLWSQEVGPARWFGVVVAFEGKEGRVITAHGSSIRPFPARRGEPALRAGGAYRESRSSRS